jgi:transposase
MPRVYILNLQVEDRAALEAVVSRGENWRCRERAQTLLLLDEGVSAFDAAKKLGVNFRTVHTTRRNWFREGLASLPDLPRSGAPKKILPEQLAKIIAMAIAEPLTAKQLLAQHVQCGGTLVNVATLTKALKSSGMVWKRTRHSLKKT